MGISNCSHCRRCVFPAPPPPAVSTAITLNIPIESHSNLTDGVALEDAVRCEAIPTFQRFELLGVPRSEAALKLLGVPWMRCARSYWPFHQFEISLQADGSKIALLVDGSIRSKNMDTYSHQADLNALSKLYWLVQVGDPGGQSLVTKVLDEGSAIFLRKLLDDATTKIYENMTKKLEQSEDHLEMRYRSRTSLSDRSAHKKVVEEKTSKVECPRVINGALDRIASLGPKLERLSKPYSNSIASSSTSSYEKTASNSASRFSSDFNLSSATQFGTSLSRTTSSHSSFSSSFDHGDDELSPSEYYQSRQRSHKRMGKLSKLKDKLGTIFHHHHHHHHHHHGQHPRDTEASGSLWKKDGKMFRKVEAQIEKKYIGTKKVKAEVQKRPEISKGKHERRNKLQGGNLQDPVGGLMRNAKNPNKPKQGGREANCIKVTQKPGDKIHQRRKGLRLRR